MESNGSKQKKKENSMYKIVRNYRNQTTLEAAVRKMIAQHWKKG